MRISNIVMSSLLTAASVGAFAACGNSKTEAPDVGASTSAGGSSTGKGGSTGTGAGTASGGSSTGKGGAGNILGGGGGPGGPGAGGAGTTCNSGPNEDGDKDGWTPAQGDCNDCDANVNPGALDIVNKDMMGMPLAADKQVDEDCDGTATQPGDLSCDSGLSITGDAFDAAKAMELCNVHVDGGDAPSAMKKWGVTQAVYGGITGPTFKTPLPTSSQDPKLNYGILPNFGPKTVPQGGHSIFVLASGEARAPGQAGFLDGMQCGFDKGYSDGYPTGFPKSGSCGTQGDPHDGVALDLEIRVPTNAHTMTFNFRFFTCEYPMYTCEIYNDIFAVLMNPSPLPMTDPMWPDIAFESKGMMKNVIGVNNESFLTACKKGVAVMGNYANCAGEGDLTGSGFEGHAASAWLQSQVPVNAGQKIVLRMAVWDSQDGILDTLTAVDNFQFTADQGTGVGTVIVPNPN